MLNLFYLWKNVLKQKRNVETLFKSVDNFFNQNYEQIYYKKAQKSFTIFFQSFPNSQLDISVSKYSYIQIIFN